MRMNFKDNIQGYLKVCHIEDVPELMLQTWRESRGHRKDLELNIGTHGFKHHFNPLKASCFCLFFTHLGVAFGC